MKKFILVMILLSLTVPVLGEDCLQKGKFKTFEIMSSASTTFNTKLIMATLEGEANDYYTIVSYSYKNLDLFLKLKKAYNEKKAICITEATYSYRMKVNVFYSGETNITIEEMSTY